jgi:hypothetical protein
MAPARAEAGGTPWPAAREAQALPMVHETLIRLFLHDLDDARNPSYSLVMVNTGHGGPAVTARFDQTSTVARSPLSGAPAHRRRRSFLKLPSSFSTDQLLRMAAKKLEFGGYLGFGGFLTCDQKFALWAALYIGGFR